MIGFSVFHFFVVKKNRSDKIIWNDRDWWHWTNNDKKWKMKLKVLSIQSWFLNKTRATFSFTHYQNFLVQYLSIYHWSRFIVNILYKNILILASQPPPKVFLDRSLARFDYFYHKKKLKTRSSYVLNIWSFINLTNQNEESLLTILKLTYFSA